MKLPYYTFRNKKTKKEYTEFMSISDRDRFLEETPEVEQVISNSTPTIDPVMLGRLKPPSDFQKYVLGRVKNNVPNNNIGNRHFDIPKEF